MAAIKLEPIASALARMVRLDLLFSPEVLEHMRTASASSGQMPFDPETKDFLHHYMCIIGATWQLLGAPQFERLSRMHEALEEELMPGGPPMSPVYDSYMAQHVLGQVAHGVAGETPLSVMARLTKGDPSRAALHEMAQCLATAHCDLYRVTHAEGLSATLEPLRGGAALAVRLTGPFLRTGDRALARVLHFRGSSFIADSPYLLRASDEDWLAYLARAASKPAHASAPARGGNAVAKQKLSPKRLARQRQEQKRAAASVAPDHEVVRLLKHGRSERYWLDFIMDAYAGERNGIVFLDGVPDQPETLPHHPDYAGPPEGRSRSAPGTAMARVRDALIDIAERDGVLSRVEQQILGECERAGLPRRELEDNYRTLLTAYCTLGAPNSQGLTALEQLRRQRGLPDDERLVVEALAQGWFSVLRIDRIELDRGLHVMDVLRRKRLFVSERAATRQVATGDLLLGWLYQEQDDTLILEGGLLHVRSYFADAIAGAARAMRDDLAKFLPSQSWRLRAAALPPLLIANVRVMMETLRSAAAAMPRELEALPPELSAQLEAVVLNQIRKNLDEPIPQFRGKTLRGLARGASSRADAIAWLREQERILKLNPQLAKLDLRPLWQELKLDYQGLDTDRPR